MLQAFSAPGVASVVQSAQALAAQVGAVELPAPWLACKLGWFVAEHGRQPWTIYGVMAAHMSESKDGKGTAIFKKEAFGASRDFLVSNARRVLSLFC